MESTVSSAAPVAALKSARCVLFAYHEMGYACMEAILKMGAPIAALVTHRDDPREEIWWRSCAELAERHGIPVHTVDGADGQLAAIVGEAKPGVIYSFYYRYLIPESVLAMARLGAFNMHGSLLPAYRGRSPVNWMLVNGEHEAGVTLHQMVARADAGDIVGQRAVAIDDSDNALTLYRKLVPLGVELINEMHPQIVAGNPPRRKMDVSKGSYFGRRKPEDGRIDWRWPSRRIFNLVGGRKLLVWEASFVVGTAARSGAPGEIVGEAADGALEIAAGEGTVIVRRVQFEGGAENLASAVLSGVRSGNGSILLE